MTESTFTHCLFWNNPLSALCFFAFAMSFISLWIRKTPWLWGSFLFIAYLLALLANIADWITLVPILILLFCHYFLAKEISRGTRYLLFCTAVIISAALAFHFLPGFHNWELIKGMQVTPGAYPFDLWLNFDKPFMGIFVLAFALPLISTKARWLQMLKVGLPMSLAGILILMGVSLYSGKVQWDPKIPVIFFAWTVNNLIFVSIPEEAFFRGFFQREIYQWFGKTSLAGLGSILVTSILFTLIHLIWVANLPFLGLVFIASVIYGTIYQVTQSIEASILCHFGLNLTHFLLFSYPALQM